VQTSVTVMLQPTIARKGHLMNRFFSNLGNFCALQCLAIAISSSGPEFSRAADGGAISVSLQGQANQSVETAGHLPHVFLGCAKGAWHLNGASGSVLHVQNRIVEHWSLVYDGSDSHFYYYHEREPSGDFGRYRWAFRRGYNPCRPCVAVWRSYPYAPDYGRWTYVCSACPTYLSPQAASTTESRASEAAAR
jgi:hypothetical protein